MLFIAAALTVVLVSRHARRAMIGLTFLVGGFWLTHAVYRQGTLAIYHVRPYAQIDWTLLQGTNFGSQGMWNEADARNFMAHPRFEEALAFARAEALHRITSEPRRFVNLVIRKQVELWRDDGYGVYWSFLEFEETPHSAAVMAWKDTLGWVSQCYHVLVMLLGTAGCFLAMRTDSRPGVALMILILLGGTLMHGIIEVQSRYHYVLEPALLVLAAMAAVSVVRQRPFAS